MDFFWRFLQNPSQNEKEVDGGGRRNSDGSLVTPPNQPNIQLQQQEQLLRAPRALPNRVPVRRRHVSDEPLQLPPQQQQLPSNQNRAQRQENSGQRPRFYGRQRLARDIVDFASGYGNTAKPRPRVFVSTSHQILSAAHPANFVKLYLNELVRPSKFAAILRTPPLAKQEAEKHAWNSDDRSPNIFVKENDPFTMHRLPVAQSTDCIRGKVGYSRGFHVWEMTWPVTQRGTHALVGVATKNALLRKNGYTSLLGSDTESYGWDLNKNKCYHDSPNTLGWIYPHNSPRTYKVPDKFYCILDMDEGYLAFATQDEYLGVAFRGLKGKTLFPIVSAVWGHCEISMQYVAGIEPMPCRLMDACRKTIRIQMNGANLNTLDLPPRLLRYLHFK